MTLAADWSQLVRDWTSPGLGVLTAVYVVLTFFVLRASRRASDAAAAAAASSERAAMATERAVDVAEAGLKIDFEVTAQGYEVDGILYFRLMNTGVYVHIRGLDVFVVARRADGEFEQSQRNVLQPTGSGQYPLPLQPGDGWTFTSDGLDLPAGMPQPTDLFNKGFATIDYSVSATGSVRRRQVEIQFEP